MSSYSILLADDHALLRQGIRRIIEEQEDLEVVGEVGDGIALMERVNKKRPDMIILDISVPTGFATVAESLDSVREMEKVKRIEQAGRKVIFYVDELESGETIEFRFQVRALFPVKAIVGTSTAYSYYETDLRAEVAGPNIVVE